MLSEEQAKKLKLLASLIENRNKQHNLTSANTAQHLYDYHINDCVQAFRVVQAALCETVIDCGSGGGLPGLVWAALEQDKVFYTVDSNNKKTAFQKLAARELGLTNVVAINERIQNIILKEENTVVFKAFSSIKKGALSINKKNNNKNLLFLKNDNEKTKQEITEATSLLYDYKRHKYASNSMKMVVLELYDS